MSSFEEYVRGRLASEYELVGNVFKIYSRTIELKFEGNRLLGFDKSKTNTFVSVEFPRDFETKTFKRAYTQFVLKCKENV